MNERVHETALRQMTAPSPAPRARAAAKRAALEEFARSRAADQGSAAPDRLSRQESHGRFVMNWWVPRGWSGAFASVCVVALATAVFWPMASRNIAPLPEFEPQGAVVDDVRGARVSPDPRPIEPAPAQPVAADPPPPPQARIAAKVEAPTTGASPEASRREEFERPAAAAATPAPAPAEADEVVVSSYRSQLRSSLEAKREAPAIVDSITSEDIGKVSKPDARNRPGNPKLAAGKPAAAPQATAGALSRAPQPASPEAEGNDKFRHFEINPIRSVAQEPVSTFSVDVDTASYAFVRRALKGGALPAQDSVRVEELVNYFDYAWPTPDSRAVPFEPTIVVGDSPWGEGKKLVHVAIKGYEMPRDVAPDVNLVLLLDVSGSMNSPDKLPLAVQSMEMLLGSLKPTDTIGIVVYAGAAGMVLEPTPVSEREKIVAALRSLSPGGSTAGAAGIQLAYELAEKHFRKGGVNRILLATDGDFNVGVSSTEQLQGLVERKRESGVMLSVLGFGRGNYRDELSQALAQNGNGVAAYIDSPSEARKVLVEESSGTLFTIAKDVKIQVEFNPATVAEYRLVGYETRALKREDFNNDAVDAGDVGSGHTVTAIYEITPVGSAASVDPLRYDTTGPRRPATGKRDEYGFLKIRYKLPGERRSKLIERPIPVESVRVPEPVRREVRFSTAVAGFGQILRGGTYTGDLGFEDVIREAQAAEGPDEFGHRAEFIELVRKAKEARR
jgi:Ca-activated chloride channel family protein